MKPAFRILILACIPCHAFSAVPEVTRILSIKNGSAMVTIAPERSGSKINVSTLCPSQLFMTDSGSNIPAMAATVLVKRLTPCQGCSLKVVSFMKAPVSCASLYAPSLAEQAITMSVADSFSFRWAIPLPVTKMAEASAFMATYSNVGIWLFSPTMRDSFVGSTMSPNPAVETRQTSLPNAGKISMANLQGSLGISYSPNLASPLVSIFDVRGNLVRQILGKKGGTMWNRKDERGKPVAPGIYTVAVTDQSTNYKGTHRFFVRNP